MDKDFSLNGRTYISAVRAAKKVGYASDYVGQLCRRKKVPGKLIGKTWYIDIDALLEHKRDRKRGRHAKSHFEPTAGIVTDDKKLVSFEIGKDEKEKLEDDRDLTSEISSGGFEDSVVIRYESDDRPRLPELSKRSLDDDYRATNKLAKTHSRSIATRFATVVVVVLMVSAGFVGLGRYSGFSVSNIASKFESLSPQSELAFVGAFLDWVEKMFGRNDGGGIAVESERTAYEPSGIVVVPDEEGSEEIARIKRAFSDDVEIRFDQDGESGVIVPVFHDGDDTENYAFLLVPINSEQPTTDRRL